MFIIIAINTNINAKYCCTNIVPVNNSIVNIYYLLSIITCITIIIFCTIMPFPPFPPLPYYCTMTVSA